MIMVLADPILGKALEQKKPNKKLECRTLGSYVVNVYTFRGSSENVKTKKQIEELKI